MCVITCTGCHHQNRLFGCSFVTPVLLMVVFIYGCTGAVCCSNRSFTRPVFLTCTCGRQFGCLVRYVGYIQGSIGDCIACSKYFEHDDCRLSSELGLHCLHWLSSTGKCGFVTRPHHSSPFRKSMIFQP